MRRAGRRRLRHQLFVWFAVIIVVTGALTSLVFRLMQPLPFATHLEQVQAFAAAQFAARWHDPERRDAFTRELAEAFEATVWLEGADGRELLRAGPAQCRGWTRSFEVSEGERRLGRVNACFRGRRHFNPLNVLLVLGTAGLVLWVGAALVARRITRPLSLLIGTTREIGSGNLSARVRLGRHQGGELGLLAESVNDMAQRIERQMRDQRELLAAVSHEVRSPLARLRVCAEILRSDAPKEPVLDAVEREIEDLDALIGKLLASSRLDFETLTKKDVPAAEIFAGCIERHGLRADMLHDETGGAHAPLDATLIARALDNLLDNAVRHGGGPVRCVLRAREGRAAAPSSSAEPGPRPSELVFEVEDRGGGISPQLLPHVFEAFHKGGERSKDGPASLGLGLALVLRIARAHGGTAWAENLAEGGARLSLSVRAA